MHCVDLMVHAGTQDFFELIDFVIQRVRRSIVFQSSCCYWLVVKVHFYGCYALVHDGRVNSVMFSSLQLYRWLLELDAVGGYVLWLMGR